VRAEGLTRDLLKGDARGSRRAKVNPLGVTSIVVLWGAAQHDVPHGAEVDGIAFIPGRKLVSWLAQLDGQPVDKAAATDVVRNVQRFRCACRESAGRARVSRKVVTKTSGPDSHHSRPTDRRGLDDQIPPPRMSPASASSSTCGRVRTSSCCCCNSAPNRRAPPRSKRSPATGPRSTWSRRVCVRFVVWARGRCRGRIGAGSVGRGRGRVR
jgi:hypothetical protein